MQFAIYLLHFYLNKKTNLLIDFNIYTYFCQNLHRSIPIQFFKSTLTRDLMQSAFFLNNGIFLLVWLDLQTRPTFFMWITTSVLTLYHFLKNIKDFLSIQLEMTINMKCSSSKNSPIQWKNYHSSTISNLAQTFS